jgi:predicted O-methyltransferase YrrM
MTTSTLYHDSVSATLQRLIKDMANDRQRREALVAQMIKDGIVSPDEDLRQFVIRKSRENYTELYVGMLSSLYLAIAPEFGKMLYMQAVARRAKTIVEFGTSFGVSTIYLAAALRDNGGGKLITTEFEAGKVARAKQNLTEAGLVDLVEFRYCCSYASSVLVQRLTTFCVGKGTQCRHWHTTSRRR